MQSKLRCIIVDDFYPTLVEIQKLCQDSPFVEITEIFSSPKKFLEVAPTLSYDLCIIDIFMPEMDGLAVAKMLNEKPVIFVTDVYNKLKEAIDLIYPIDIITKPIKKPRLNRALEKAYKILHFKPEAKKDKEFEIFHIAESKRKTRLRLQDIVLVQTDLINSRNKKVYMRNGEQYTLMRCSNEKLLSMSSKLVQVNKAELVSMDAIRDFRHNEVTINNIPGVEELKKLTLNRIFRNHFINKMTQ